jgi:hypothetical protein
MENKQIDIDCPCCSSRLTIDVLTRTVLRAVSSQESEEGDDTKRGHLRWDKATERVEGRTEKAKDKLDSAISMEKSKEDRLDDLFKKANDKLKRKSDDDEWPVP